MVIIIRNKFSVHNDNITLYISHCFSNVLRDIAVSYEQHSIVFNVLFIAYLSKMFNIQDAMTLITWIISLCWTFRFGCWIIRWATRDLSVQRTPYGRDDFADDHSTASSEPNRFNDFRQTGT